MDERAYLTRIKGCFKIHIQTRKGNPSDFINERGISFLAIAGIAGKILAKAAKPMLIGLNGHFDQQELSQKVNVDTGKTGQQ